LHGETWQRIATSAVGIFRANYAVRPEDPEFEALVAALREFPEFERRWGAQYTAPMSQLLSGYLGRADLGLFRLFCVRLQVPEVPGFVLMQPPADEATKTALDRLARGE
jgi:hypothetical protein